MCVHLKKLTGDQARIYPGGLPLCNSVAEKKTIFQKDWVNNLTILKSRNYDFAVFDLKYL